MAVYDLEEQEQLDELKTWWKQYGNLVTGIVTAGAIIALGWQGWNWWQREQSAQAAAIFAGVQQAAAQNDAKRARELAGELIDKYSRTSYAEMGALVSARIQVDAGDSKNARIQLAWVAESAREPGLRDLARLRLAAVLLDEKLYDEATRQLAGEPAKPFLRRYAELRGDILAAQGKSAEARLVYDAALALPVAGAKDQEIQRRTAYGEVIQAKRDSVGGVPQPLAKIEPGAAK